MKETSPRAAFDLLFWFDRVARSLPWRQSKDPYRVWVSEVMLQQTRVDVVIPYYLRFIESFPTLRDLASASINEVLARWSGLGYYRRARLMHAASQQMIQMGGQIPTSKAELRKLPGFGDYTAAAVASIAFGEAVPVIDGNVERVLSRRLALTDDPKKRHAREMLVLEALRLLDPRRAGDSNQALMELGATICTPSRPRCEDCPVSSGCLGREAGKPEIFPMLRKRRQAEKLYWLGAVVEHQGRFLLFRRSEGSAVLGGTWEIPWVEESVRSTAGAALGNRYGAKWVLGSRLGQVRHQITYRAIEVEVVRAQVHWGGAFAEGRDAGWFSPAELNEVAVSSLVKKILDVALGSVGWQDELGSTRASGRPGPRPAAGRPPRK